MFGERIDDLVDGESAAIGVRQDARDEGPQPAGLLSSRPRLRPPHGDERPDAAACLEHTGALELGIDARDGVRIDAQLDRELANGRQLFSGLQPAGGDGRA